MRVMGADNEALLKARMVIRASRDQELGSFCKSGSVKASQLT